MLAYSVKICWNGIFMLLTLPHLAGLPTDLSMLCLTMPLMQTLSAEGRITMKLYLTVAWKVMHWLTVLITFCQLLLEWKKEVVS